MSYRDFMSNGYMGGAGVLGQNIFNNTPTYQPQQNMQQNNFGLNMSIQFASKEEMEAFRIPPSTQAMAFGKEGDVFYIKSTDNLGRSNLKIYDFKERDINKEINMTEKENPDISSIKEDISRINEKINLLEEEIKNINNNNITKQIEVDRG